LFFGGGGDGGQQEAGEESAEESFHGAGKGMTGVSPRMFIS
jgi:hypothetical protein